MSRESWTQETFDRIYAASDDPWGFDTSAYEAAKYADTLAALGDGRFGSALELGCGNGAMTVRLAERCDRLLALDIAPAAVALARTRCAALPHVRVEVARLPADFPAGRFDLVIISELLYFLGHDDIDRLAGLVRPVAQVVLVNWTGDTDTPCTGDEAAERFIASFAGDWRQSRKENYRIDVLIT